MNELFQWIVNLLKDARFWQIVLPWERAVRVRFGKWTVLWEPGIHLRVPFFDEVRVVNTRLLIAACPCQTVSTKDRIAVTVAALVAFRIVDPMEAIMRLRDPESCAASFAQAAMAQQIAGHDLSGITPETLEQAALEAVRKLGAGFEFESVRIVDFAAVRTIRLLQEQWRPHTGHSGGTL